MTDRLEEIKKNHEIRETLNWRSGQLAGIWHEVDWLIAEVEHLRRYADKLHAGWTWDFLPKDVEIINAANAQLATQVMELEAELEKLRGGIK